MRVIRGSGRRAGAVVGLGVGLLLVTGCGDGAGDSSADAEVNRSAPPANRAAEALLEAEDAMASLDDYTFRGEMTFPDDGSPIAGREAVVTMRVTTDGRCETTVDLGDGIEFVRRTIGRWRYLQFSSEFLAISEMEPAMKQALEGRWATEPADPDVTCDMTKLSESVDLETAEAGGKTTVAGDEAAIYTAEAKQGSDVSARLSIASEGEPLILRIEGGAAGFDVGLTLISRNDGFAIDRPADDVLVQAQG